MNSQDICRVVAVRKDGTRVVLSRHHAPDIAQKVLGLVKHGTSYLEVRIESDTDGEMPETPVRKRKPK